MDTLALFFPQGQGSSIPDPHGLTEGAYRLRELFPEQDFAHIEMDYKQASGSYAGVKAQAELLEQANRARAVIEASAPAHLLTLGGDCSVDLAPVAYLNERYDDLAVLWLDAHADLNTPESSPSGALHGMVLRLLLGEGVFSDMVRKPLEPPQVFLLGVRDFDPPERAFADAKSLRHFGVAELETRPEQLVETLRARGFGRLHLHFDLDALNPEVFAATGYPTAAGFGLPGITELFRILATSFEVVGVTVTEYLPQLGGEAGEQAVLETLIGSLPKL